MNENGAVLISVIVDMVHETYLELINRVSFLLRTANDNSRKDTASACVIFATTTSPH